MSSFRDDGGARRIALVCVVGSVELTETSEVVLFSGTVSGFDGKCTELEGNTEVKEK